MLEKLITEYSPDGDEKLKHFLNTLKCFADSAEEFSSWVQSAVDPLIKQLSSLDCDESDLKQDLRECTAKLWYARTFANYFIIRLHDFFKLVASDRNEIQKIKYSVQKGDNKKFENYISQLKMVMANCRKRYVEFEEKHKDAKEFCEKTLRKIETKISAAHDKKVKCRVVATTAVLASVTAGFFTFGIGTIVGLSAAAAGTFCLGQSYAVMEATFKSFRRIMDKLSKTATNMGPFIAETERMLLTNTEDKMEDVATAKAQCYSIDMVQLSQALDALAEFGQYYFGCMRNRRKLTYNNN